MKISRKGMKRGVKFQRTELPPSTRGKNKRGVCAHKATKGAKAAKRQNVPGWAPSEVTAYRPRLDRV